MKSLDELQTEKKLALIQGYANDKLVEFNTRKFRLNNNDRSDLVQMVYLYLLEMTNEAFFDIVDRGKMDSYIKRIAVLQYKSSTSRFYKEIIKFQLTTNPIEDYNETI